MTSDQAKPTWEQYKQPTGTPSSLWSAARDNQVGELARLLDEGAPIDERDHRGYAPLMLAAYAGSLDAVELLLARGADPNTTDLFGNTVLMGAAYKGFVKIVLRLLTSGADLAAMNYGGLDARGFALTYGQDAVFAVLEQHAQRTNPVPPAPLPAAPPHPALAHSPHHHASPQHTN